MSKLLEGKVALVTGGAHGIGRGHALELAKHGAKVVINDLGTSVHGEGAGRDADVVVDIIKAAGGEASANYGDVSEEKAAQGMVQQAIDDFGKLDILVNNAGIVRDKALWNMSVSDFDLVMNVHVRGTWLTSHFAAQHWKGRFETEGQVGGRVINTTSGAGLQGNFGQTNYATAKAAIAGFTQTASLELAKFGVTVNCISPAAATRITASVASWDFVAAEPDEIDTDNFDPMDPSVSSPVVAWLASDEARFVSGQVIRAVRDRIEWLKPWSSAGGLSSGDKRWNAEKLGAQLEKVVFGTRAPGLQA